MKVRRLKRLRIKRVDLVERGANQEADVVLFKAEEPPEGQQFCPKCNERYEKGTKVCAKCGTELTKAASAAKEKLMPENVEQIEKLQKDLTAATELAEEESRKREAVEKALKEQAETLTALKKRLDEAEDSAKLAEFKKTVDAFEHLPVKADTFAPILKKCAEALDAAGYAELMRVLKAADAATASNFAEIGAPGADTNARSAAEELDAKADELVTKSGLKKDAALVQAMVQNPKLAARYRRESYAARQAES